MAIENGEIQIYNIDKMKIVKTIQAHSYDVNRLHLLNNGDLLSGSGDGEIKLWKMLDIN